MKVVHLTSVHAPLDIRIFHKECLTLAVAGYEVVLIAPYARDQMSDKLRTRMVPIPRSRFARMTRTAWQIFRMAVNEHANVYHFHDPELIPVGLLLRLLGGRVVYDAHEDVPKQVLSKHWIPQWLRAYIADLAAVAELLGGLSFNGVVAATPTIGKRFPKRKTYVVQNFPIADELISNDSASYAERPLAVTYIGGISAVRGIKEIVHAMNMIPEDLTVRLLLAGVFDPPEFEDEVKKMTGWVRVDFLGWQSREGVLQALGRSRIGLVLLHPRPNFLESYPIKLFEYMSAGIPIIASDFPLWRQIVETSGCGLLADPLNPRAIADAIQWLLQHEKEAEAMGRRGIEAVKYRFNWAGEAKKLLNLYENLAPASQASLAPS